MYTHTCTYTHANKHITHVYHIQIIYRKEKKVIKKTVKEHLKGYHGARQSGRSFQALEAETGGSCSGWAIQRDLVSNETKQASKQKVSWVEDVALLEEHWTSMHRVPGSNPSAAHNRAHSGGGRGGKVRHARSSLVTW